jgi:P pilus assembly chaperone PapD
MPIALALLMLATFVTSTPAQVPPSLELRDGIGSTPIRNGGDDPVEVTIGVWHSDESTTPPTLTEPAPARVWPRTFTLAPGAQRTVRVLLTSPLPPGTRLRLETLMVPQPDTDPDGAVEGVRAVITMSTRYLTWVVLP